MSASPRGAEADAEPDARVGTVLGGRYRLLARLGEGGMGAVYVAEHLELGSRAAVKVLAPELARNRRAIERFEREARTASQVRHPSVVHVYDLGRTPDGSPYLAMELLEGRDLAAELDAHGGVLLGPRLVAILRPVAAALDACHAKGVVHRDLKPSNVFLAQRGDGRTQPVVVDFGLALLLASDERLTNTGAVAGTPHYVPPEAARGELAGPAGDVYALATVAYRALTGVTPFDGALATGVLVQKIVDEPPTMRARAGVDHGDAVEAVIARGLARDPEARHATAAELVEALAAALGLPTAAKDSDASGLLRVAAAAPPSSPEGRARESHEILTGRAAARGAVDPEAVTLDVQAMAASVAGASRDGVRLDELAPPPLRAPEPARGFDDSEGADAAVDAAPTLAGAPPARRLGPVLGAAVVAIALLLAGGWTVSSLVGSTSARVPLGTAPEPLRLLPSEPPRESPRESPEGDGPLAASALPRGIVLDDGPLPEGLAPPEGAEDAPTDRPRPEDAPRPTRVRDAEDPVARTSTREVDSAPAPAAPVPAATAEDAPSDAAAMAEADRMVRTAGSLLVRGELDGAIRLLRRATREAPRHAGAWRSLGLAYERAQEPAEARAAYGRYLDLAPGASDAASIRTRAAAL